MNRDDLYRSFGELDDDILERSERKKRPMWIKWAAIAACLCLVAGIALPVLHFKGGQDPVTDIAALEYNGKFYEAVDIPEVLEKYGLPRKITADMAGRHLGYLKHNGVNGFECTAMQTDMELYQYAPAVCDGVMVLRDGDQWFAALFCNFYQFDSNTSTELTELYRVYGIESAADIASITEMGQGSKQEIGTPVTDPDEIAEFYGMTTALWSYGNDDFQAEMFDIYTDEEDQVAVHNAFAEDRRNIRIETTEGLRFFIAIYPSFDWIYGGGTMSYFKMDDQMHAWVDRNLNK